MRECKHFHAPGVLHEPCKDCLIEHQATRIAELESRQVVSGAMCVIEGRCLSGEQYQRIKELEAALCEEVEARSKWYCEADRLKEELAAALRAAIESAQKVECEHNNRECTYESDDGEFERWQCKDCGERWGVEIAQ